MDIERLDLSVRAYHSLKNAGITHITTLKNMSDEELMNVKHFNQRCLEEVRMKIENIDELSNGGLSSC